MVIIGLVLVTVLLLLLIRATSQVLTWIAVAVLFAVALHPAVTSAVVSQDGAAAVRDRKT